MFLIRIPSIDMDYAQSLTIACCQRGMIIFPELLETGRFPKAGAKFQNARSSVCSHHKLTHLG